MAARRTILSALTVLAVGLSLLSGCTPADPAGQPTYSCTPDDGSTPYPCYKVQYDAKAKETALYAEAEGVYRKFFAEEERIYRSGGVTQPTSVLLETTTGDYQAAVMAVYSDLVKYKTSAIGGTFKLVWTKHVPTGGRPGIVTALQTCVDASSVRMTAKGADPAPGGIASEVIYFSRDGDSLKLTDLDPKEVTQC